MEYHIYFRGICIVSILYKFSDCCISFSYQLLTQSAYNACIYRKTDILTIELSKFIREYHQLTVVNRGTGKQILYFEFDLLLCL